MAKINFKWFFLALCLFGNCVDPYQPPVSSNSINVLVVDGFMNSSDSTVRVKLSRAELLSSSQQPPLERNAIVSVEEEQGNSYVLSEVTAGTYSASVIPNSEKKYRLHVQTTDGKKYSSDFVALQQPPEIDSVSWEPSSDGVTISANSHDPSGKTQYYRWTYEETWEYASAYSPALMVVNGEVIARSPSDNIHFCWKTDSSSQILIYSTTKLSMDVVSKFQLNFLPKGTEKLTRRYSIIIHQMGMSEDGYNFWARLQTTTQNLGGLFDALPTQVLGNVQNDSNPDEIVLGFFEGGSVTSKRIFIDNSDLPRFLNVLPNFGQCEIDSIPVSQIPYTHNGTLLIGSYGSPATIGYLSSSENCMDCRKEGGNTTPPGFW